MNQAPYIVDLLDAYFGHTSWRTHNLDGVTYLDVASAGALQAISALDRNVTFLRVTADFSFRTHNYVSGDILVFNTEQNRYELIARSPDGEVVDPSASRGNIFIQVRPYFIVRPAYTGNFTLTIENIESIDLSSVTNLRVKVGTVAISTIAWTEDAGPFVVGLAINAANGAAILAANPGTPSAIEGEAEFLASDASVVDTVGFTLSALAAAPPTGATRFADLPGQIADSQIPSFITRDTELQNAVEERVLQADYDTKIQSIEAEIRANRDEISNIETGETPTGGGGGSGDHAIGASEPAPLNFRNSYTNLDYTNLLGSGIGMNRGEITISSPNPDLSRTVTIFVEENDLPYAQYLQINAQGLDIRIDKPDGTRGFIGSIRSGGPLGSEGVFTIVVEDPIEFSLEAGQQLTLVIQSKFDLLFAAVEAMEEEDTTVSLTTVTTQVELDAVSTDGIQFALIGAAFGGHRLNDILLYADDIWRFFARASIPLANGGGLTYSGDGALRTTPSLVAMAAIVDALQLKVDSLAAGNVRPPLTIDPAAIEALANIEGNYTVVVSDEYDVPAGTANVLIRIHGTPVYSQAFADGDSRTFAAVVNNSDAANIRRNPPSEDFLSVIVLFRDSSNNDLDDLQTHLLIGHTDQITVPFHLSEKNKLAGLENYIPPDPEPPPEPYVHPNPSWMRFPIPQNANVTVRTTSAGALSTTAIVFADAAVNENAGWVLNAAKNEITLPAGTYDFDIDFSLDTRTVSEFGNSRGRMRYDFKDHNGMTLDMIEGQGYSRAYARDTGFNEHMPARRRIKLDAETRLLISVSYTHLTLPTKA